MAARDYGSRCDTEYKILDYCLSSLFPQPTSYVVLRFHSRAPRLPLTSGTAPYLQGSLVYDGEGKAAMIKAQARTHCLSFFVFLLKMFGCSFAGEWDGEEALGARATKSILSSYSPFWYVCNCI